MLCREYCVDLRDPVTRVKVPWRVPGCVWLRSTHPDIVKLVASHMNLSGQGASSHIPIAFYKPAAKRTTVEVHVSAAPPEFRAARRYLLRFHLTTADETPPKRRTTEDKQEVARLETMIKTERLMELHRQCLELRGLRCPRLWRDRPFTEAYHQCTINTPA